MFYVPPPSLLRPFPPLSFFCQIFVFLYILGYLGLKGSHISSKKKNKNKRPIRKRLGMDTLNTREKFHGLYLKNGVDIWTFEWESGKK